MIRKIPENIKVLLRLRPKQDDEGETCVSCASNNTLIVNVPNQPSSEFTCDQCFSEDCSQHDFFERSGVDEILDHVLQGYSSTIFAYGPTGIL